MHSPRGELRSLPLIREFFVNSFLKTLQRSQWLWQVVYSFAYNRVLRRVRFILQLDLDDKFVGLRHTLQSSREQRVTAQHGRRARRTRSMSCGKDESRCREKQSKMDALEDERSMRRRAQDEVQLHRSETHFLEIGVSSSFDKTASSAVRRTHCDWPSISAEKSSTWQSASYFFFSGTRYYVRMISELYHDFPLFVVHQDPLPRRHAAIQHTAVNYCSRQPTTATCFVTPAVGPEQALLP